MRRSGVGGFLTGCGSLPWSAVRRPVLAGLVVVVVATGCGPLGDDDDDGPTATVAGQASPQATPGRGPVQATEPSRAATPGAGTQSAAVTTGPVATQPVVAGSPVATTADDPTEPAGEAAAPPIVEDCAQPEELPEFSGRRNRVVSEDASDGINFRNAPGSECDVIATLEPGSAVLVLSGAVEADGVLWVQVRVDDEEGWVAEEFLTAPPSA